MVTFTSFLKHLSIVDVDSIYVPETNFAFLTASNYLLFMQTHCQLASCDTMAFQRRNVLSLGEKVQIIAELDKGKRTVDVCRQFALVSSTVSSIRKNKDKILSNYQKSGKNTKRIRAPAKKDVDEELLTWYKQQKSQNVAISGPMLKKKAEQLAKMKNYKDFVCSNGWIDRFKNRYNIVLNKVWVKSEEKNVENWLNNVWPNLRQGYHDDDIFSAVETGLFYRVTPDQTLSFKNKKCFSGELSSERLTVFVCSNMSGSEKRTLVVIGNRKDPKCFRYVKTSPVRYLANNKAWMTSKLFEEEVRQWDLELKENNRRILLVVDSCPAHPNITHLEMIKMVFPLSTNKNHTSLQPMQQGVIQSLKCNYRKALLSQILEHLHEKKDFKINLLVAIHCLAKAWRRVTQNTIKRAFNDAGFESDETQRTVIFKNAEKEKLPLSELIRAYRSSCNLPFSEDLFDYSEVDVEVQTSSRKSNGQMEDINEEETLSDEEENDVQPPPSLKEARQAIRLLSHFYVSRITRPDILKNIGVVEDDIEHSVFFS